MGVAVLIVFSFAVLAAVLAQVAVMAVMHVALVSVFPSEDSK